MIVRIPELNYTMDLMNDQVPAKQIRFILEGCKIPTDEAKSLIYLAKNILVTRQCSKKYSTISK